MKFSRVYEVIVNVYDHTVNFIRVVTAVFLLTAFWIGVRVIMP